MREKLLSMFSNSTEKQIAEFLGMEEVEVHDTIQNGLSNIVGTSAITMTGAESARQQLIETRQR